MAKSNNPELIIKQILHDAKLTAQSERIQETEKRLNIYRDKYKEILEEEVNNQFTKKTREHIKQMIDDSQNVLKRIVDDISLVYEKEAQRSYFIGNGEKIKEDDNYQNIIKQIPTDIIMEQTNQYVNVANESIIGIVPRNNRIEYDIITPDMVEVFQDEENPTEILAILLTLTSVDTIDSTDIMKVYWDVFGNHKMFDANDKEIPIDDNEEGINPYKDPNNSDRTILPFVIFHKKYPVDSVFERTAGNDLISATTQVGVLLTYLNYLVKTQSFNQTYLAGITNKDIPAEIVFDQLHPLVIPNADGKAGTLSNMINHQTIFQTIMGKVGFIANNYGISMDQFKLTLSAESGFALKIKNQGLEKAVNKQKKMYRIGEGELAEKTRIVNNTMYKKSKISDKGTFKIDFAEMTYPTSPEENRKQWSFDMKVGAKNILQYIREINPDIKDDKAAEEMLKTNIETNNRIKADTKLDLDALFDSLLKTSGGRSGSNNGGQPSRPLI